MVLIAVLTIFENVGHVTYMFTREAGTEFLCTQSRCRVGFYLLSIILLFCAFGAHAAKKDAVVGLLSTRSSTYEGEYRTATEIRDVLLKLGARKVVMIDYNVIMKPLGDYASEEAIAERVNKFLLKHKIDRILIPGNYYNIDQPPYPPVPYRQLVTNAVVNIMADRNDLKLLAICGGLQGVLHAQSVKIKSLQKILNSSEMAASHSVSTKHPREYGASLFRVEAVPGSKLAEIIEKVRGPEDGALRFYVPDMHTEGVGTSIKNKQKLSDLGYKISAFSDDGIIEGLEDSRGNMLLQMHPEFLLVNMEEKIGHDSEVDISVKIAVGIMEYFLSR